MDSLPTSTPLVYILTRGKIDSLPLLPGDWRFEIVDVVTGQYYPARNICPYPSVHCPMHFTLSSWLKADIPATREILF